VHPLDVLHRALRDQQRVLLDRDDRPDGDADHDAGQQ
jgi:hypothetical protein